MRLSILALAAGLSLIPVTASLAGPHVKPAAAKSAAGVKDPEARLAALEAKLAKAPKDAKLKTETAEAAFQAGYYIEYKKPGLSPREKYRPALKLYRRALELNPKHVEAAKEKKQIEDIYQGMGMKIPQ
jgi:tetratricopeptide (TPR) repeat protein